MTWSGIVGGCEGKATEGRPHGATNSDVNANFRRTPAPAKVRDVLLYMVRVFFFNTDSFMRAGSESLEPKRVLRVCGDDGATCSVLWGPLELLADVVTTVTTKSPCRLVSARKCSSSILMP